MNAVHYFDGSPGGDDPRPLAERAEKMFTGLLEGFLGRVSGLSENGPNGSVRLPAVAPAELELSYRTLLEQIPAVVFMAHLNDGISQAYVSPHIEKVLGFSREEWLDDPIRWYRQIHPDDRNRWNLEAASFVLSGEPLRSLYRVLARDGHVVWFQCDVKMMRRDNGDPWFIHGVGIDVTDLKKTEMELSRARDELESRVRERTAELSNANAELQWEIAERKRAEQSLQQHAAELARANSDLEHFAYSASHDLQEPIRNVTLSAQLLATERGEGLDPRARPLLNTIIVNAEHMKTLVRDLLEYAEAARSTENIDTLTDAQKVVKTALQNLEASICSNGAEITYNGLPSVRIPSFRLEQVFQNLISNAIKYRSDKPPRIHIAAERADGFWLFSVEDNGIGIDPQYHDRIFGIFKRLHSKKQYPGTGMGLAICKRIVEGTGGKIWVESEGRKGAKFLFTIPVEQRDEVPSKPES